MIITFTANPSIDRTVALDAPLVRGEVQRAVSVSEQAGGKGVNVASVLQSSEREALALLSFDDSAFTALGARHKVAFGIVGVTVDGPYRVRVNTTITEPDGTTTKINEPGPRLSDAQVAASTDEVVRRARETGATWVVLSGSLPPGAPADWYATIVRRLHPLGCKVAVDTSDDALDATIAALPGASFSLIKPNSDELAQLTGGDAAAFEASARAGDVRAIVDAATALHDRGIENVLVTLGGAGAVLVNSQGAWQAGAPRIEVRSTVGAGDSSVAGFILADVAGRTPDRCLASAVAYGSAAASLPGTTLPGPAEVHVDDVVVTRLA